MGKVISIIGPTACGKSLLCQKLHERTNWPVIKEFEEMPPEIVDEINASQESLRIQVWFRNQRIQAAMKARELSKYGNVILDTCFITSEVHINRMEDGFDKDLAMEMFKNDLNALKLPDVVLGLMCSEEQMYRFYKKRNADYEQSEDIFNHYKELRKLYLKLYKKYPKIIKLSTEGLEFHNNQDVDKMLYIVRKQCNIQEQIR